MRQIARCVLKLTLGLALLSATSVSAQYQNESEVGIKVEGGNTVTESYNAKTLNTYERQKNIFKLGGHYTYGKSGEVEDARNWDALLRYERELNDRFSLFAASQVEGDEFKGISERYNEDIGAIYKIITEDKKSWVAELGYRYTMQNNVDGTDQNESKARLYSAYKQDLNENVKFGLWAEYLPNFSNSEAWILAFEPSFEVVMTKSLFLKLSYRGDYENEPALGAKKYDYQYLTSLIARF